MILLVVVSCDAAAVVIAVVVFAVSSDGTGAGRRSGRSRKQRVNGGQLRRSHAPGRSLHRRLLLEAGGGGGDW